MSSVACGGEAALTEEAKLRFWKTSLTAPRPKERPHLHRSAPTGFTQEQFVKTLLSVRLFIGGGGRQWKSQPWSKQRSPPRSADTHHCGPSDKRLILHAKVLSWDYKQELKCVQVSHFRSARFLSWLLANVQFILKAPLLVLPSSLSTFPELSFDNRFPRPPLLPDLSQSPTCSKQASPSLFHQNRASKGLYCYLH